MDHALAHSFMLYHAITIKSLGWAKPESEESQFLAKLVFVGAAGFEPTTSCSQIRDATVADGVSGSQPFAIIQDRPPTQVQPSQPLAGFRRHFGSPVVPDFGGADVVGGRPLKGTRRLLKSTKAPLLTATEVADRLRVCTATVYKLCSSGALPHVRVLNAVRVAEADLERFLAGRGRGR